MKTTYIFLLDEETQKSIKKEVRENLLKLGINDNEVANLLEHAMNSRLCDIEEIIDIKKYL